MRVAAHSCTSRREQAPAPLQELTVIAFLGLAFACAPVDEPPAPIESCLGSAALCDKRLDEVTLAGAHNAMSSIDDGFLVPNQNVDVDAQLALGVRAFLVDTFADDEGALFFCHSNCDLGSIPMGVFLAKLRAFLDAPENRGEIVELLIEDYITPAQFESAMQSASLDTRTYAHATVGDEWPTLRALAEADTRIIVMSQNGAPPPPWYHAMYTHFVDTPFDFADVAALEADESCALNRGADENALLLVNHWAADPLPGEAIAAEANAFDVLLERAQRCAAARGHARAHVVATDFVDVGDLVDVVAALNE
jgi:hypothetical protein